ncbi:MAG: hypothetical protein NE330_20140 [Lentisphaeraceae bacterium]|nr:hypothetical protein [Lentisphaeraceae bacterium]
MKNLLIAILFCFLCSCSSQKVVSPDQEFIKTSIKELVDSPDKFIGEDIMLEAYVMGAEYNPSEEGAHFFILSLGEEVQYDNKKGNQIFFPRVKYKVRAVEDGYNGSVIKDCYIMADNARKLGSRLTVFGRFNPDQPFYYYGNGIDIQVEKMRIGNRTVNTDYEDKSKLAHETPGMIRKLYKGGKKLIDLADKIKP